ncbi:MAG: glycoside hydrolase family 92 protein [Deltaproteobacteria bacterium]|nr:glycoside hydrolase family 92 protein [Deltaproteobacteria bacterium]
MIRARHLLPLLALLACGGGASHTDAGLDASPDAALDALVDAGPPPDSRAAAAPLTQWVNPFVGSGGLGFGYASTAPAPQRPYGMVRPGPDTTSVGGASPLNHFSGYYYDDPMIQGFSMTRAEGIGTNDYGSLGLMPVDGMTAERTTQDGYRAVYTKSTERAEPGYYAVTLEDPAIEVEVTASDRVGVFRATFPAGSSPTWLLDLGHVVPAVRVTDGAIAVLPASREIEGQLHLMGSYSGRYGGMDVFFVARFDQDFMSQGVWQDGRLTDAAMSATGAAAGAYASFAPDVGSVSVAVGLSYVDLEHARMNLDAEVPDVDFDATRAAAHDAWEEALSRVEVEGRRELDFRLFYTALYHVLSMPTLFSDVDGSYRGLDGAVHVAEGFRYYTDFSLWDTFRSMHPLVTLLYPEFQRDFNRSLVAMSNDGGYMPRWPLGAGYTGGMVGESAAIVLADSWLMGERDFDLRAAYDSLRRTAMAPTPAGAPYSGRGGIEAYLELGWVPMDESGGSASVTLEYAYDDFAMAILADALGEDSDASMFRSRADNWQNLWDAESQFLVGRARDGSFARGFRETTPQDFYVEGNAWQYVWYVPHDLEGLASLMGGRAAMLDRLETFFENSTRRPDPVFPNNFYWHGNEPDIHAPWIFSALGRPEATARWTRWVMDTLYHDAPDGLPGNDDSGTLSAWYVFSALGFFPLAATPDYLVGSPRFTKSTLRLAGGDVVIEAPESAESAIFINAASLDDAPLTQARFRRDAFAGAATLRLEMSGVAGDWGR